MKILIDPKLSVLAECLSVEERAEILMCLFSYPNRDCDIALWKYMRQQIDADTQKYKEKCERMSESRQNRWKDKSDMKNPESEQINLFSDVSKGIGKENIIKEKDNCKERGSGNALGIVDNSVKNYLITSEFSFAELGKEKPAFFEYIRFYPPVVIARAEKTLIQKRLGQQLKIQQILDWIEQQNDFYKQNNGGK